MKKVKRIFITFFLLFAFKGILSLSNIYGISSSISGGNVLQGNQITVKVNFSDDICAANFVLSYDRTKLELINGDLSYAWVEGENLPTYTFKAKSNVTGKANISLSGKASDTNYNKHSLTGGGSINITAPQVQPTPPPSNTNNNTTNTSRNANTATTTQSNTSTQTNITKNNNAYLSKLQINQEGLTPNFNKNKTSYAVTVGENVNDLNVTAVAEDSKSKVAISGNKGLKNGDNKVYITVTAQDGTKKVYTITVTKTGDPVKSNSYLQNLIVENATMSPEFSKEILEYDCGTVGASVENLKILAFGENENVKIDITGNDKLAEGDNKIIVKVTSEDGTTTKEYVITVKKDSSIVEENNIEEINALQDTDNDDNFFNKLFKSIKNNWLVCLMYILILVQFIEIVYLYKNQNVRSHKKVKEDNNIIEKNLNSDELKKSKRMSLDKEFKQNKKKRKTSENLDGGFPKKRNGANKFFDDK